MNNDWQFQPLQMPVEIMAFIAVILVVTGVVSYLN